MFFLLYECLSLRINHSKFREFMKNLLTVTFLAGLMMAGCGKQAQKHGSAASIVKTNEDSLKILYVGTYTQKEDFVDGKATGIYVYGFSATTGKLYPISTSSPTVNPSFLAVNGKQHLLYAVNETGGNQEPSGSVSAFRISPDGRSLQYLNSVPSMGDSPCSVFLDHSGHWVMCANYGSGTVSVFPVLPDGSLGKASFTDQHTGKGPKAQQTSAHAHMITPALHNPYYYSCDLGTDCIYVYRLDTTAGKLIRQGMPYTTQPGAGPRQITFHPVLPFAYEVNELNGTVEVMSVDSATGGLKRIQAISTLDPGQHEEASSGDIHIDPSGRFLYASNRGNVNNLAEFSIDLQTGKLTLIGHQSSKGLTPRYFTFDPSGNFVLVANQDSGTVATFRMDKVTGKLIDTGIITPIPSPVCLKFLP
jgi:6-phosphogluconolactonase